MLNETLKAVHATLTEGDLQAIAKTAYGELLGRTCDDQRRFPHHAEYHSLANRAYADFYQRQTENGGHVPLLDGEEVALRFRGWPQDRIDRLKDVIQLAVDGHQFIKTRFIDHHLREAGFEPSDARRSVVRRALYPAYRDACLEAERTLQAAMSGVAGGSAVATSTPTEIVPTEIVPTEIALDAAPTPSSAKDADCMSDFVEQAITDLMNDEAWVAKSGRQARSTVALFELLIGKKPFAAIVQGDLSTFKRKIRYLPTRYSMSDAGSRKVVLEAVAQGEARAAEAEKSGKKSVPSLSNRTINRHLSSLSTLLIWARGDGRTLPALSFDALQTVISKRKRARNQRPATSIQDIQKMFALPVFTGCQLHGGGTGQIILRARQSPGTVIVHDAFYWIPLLLYYTGLRREEGCKLSVDDSGFAGSGLAAAGMRIQSIAIAALNVFHGGDSEVRFRFLTADDDRSERDLLRALNLDDAGVTIVCAEPATFDPPCVCGPRCCWTVSGAAPKHCIARSQARRGCRRFDHRLHRSTTSRMAASEIAQCRLRSCLMTLPADASLQSQRTGSKSLSNF